MEHKVVDWKKNEKLDVYISMLFSEVRKFVNPTLNPLKKGWKQFSDILNTKKEKIIGF